MSKIVLGVVFFLLLLGFFSVQQSHAASLNTLSDTVSTSRPSAASPIVDNPQAAGASQVTITDNNAVFLQGYSAEAFADPNGGGETTDTGVTVASMSAANTPSSSQRIVYLTNTVTHKHHIGDAFVVPITAMHTISFKPVTSVPSGGKIVITFPTLASVDTNPASPSASAFQFNGLSNTNIQFNFSNSSTCSSITVANTGAGSAPTITCAVATSSIAGGSTVTVTALIGCSAHTGASCTTQVPTLINPMRKQPPGANAGQQSAVGSTSQADNWRITVTTQDNSGTPVNLDTSTAIVGTIESVQIQANIDPTLTFQIQGIADNTQIKNANYAGCPVSTFDTTNSGIGSSSTNVNLGTAGTGITIAGQKITVSTNGQGGYSLTATSSGHLNDAQNNYNIADNTTPAAMTAGTEFFGIHPCGTDVANASTVWNNGGNSSQFAVTGTSPNNGFVGWPSSTTNVVLASRTSTANAIVTAVEYALTASATTPAGFYTSVITYVATPSFD